MDVSALVECVVSHVGRRATAEDPSLETKSRVSGAVGALLAGGGAGIRLPIGSVADEQAKQYAVLAHKLSPQPRQLD